MQTNAQSKESKGTLKVWKIEDDPVVDEATEKTKSIRQIRTRFSDLTTKKNDPFIRLDKSLCESKIWGLDRI